MDLREALPREVLQFHGREREALEPPVRVGHAGVPLSFQLLLVPVGGQKRLELVHLCVETSRRRRGSLTESRRPDAIAATARIKTLNHTSSWLLKTGGPLGAAIALAFMGWR